MNEKIINIAVIIILILAVCFIITLVTNISTDPSYRYSTTYTLRGHLYDTEYLGNNSYNFFITDSSFRPWGGDWSFPYQQGKKIFYFTDIGDESLSNFIDRYIEITYSSNGIETEITDIKYTLYDGIRQAERETEKRLAFEEWMKEYHEDIFVEYSEYLENFTIKGT